MEFPKQRPEETQAIPGSKIRRSGWKKVSFIRCCVIAVVLYQWIAEFATGQRSARFAQENRQQGRGSDLGSAEVASKFRRGDGSRPAQETAKTPESDQEDPNKNWEERSFCSAKGTTDATVPSRRASTRGSRKVEAQKRSGTNQCRDCGPEAATTGSQDGQDRGPAGRDAGGCLGHGGRREEPATQTARRRQEGPGEHEKTGSLHAGADGHLHDELQCKHGGATKAGAAYSTVAKDPSPAGQDSSGSRNDGYQDRPDEGPEGAFRSEATMQGGTRCSLSVWIFQRSGDGDGLIRLCNQPRIRSVCDTAQSKPTRIQNTNSQSGHVEAHDCVRPFLVSILLTIALLALGPWMTTTRTTRRTTAKTWVRVLTLAATLQLIAGSEDEQVTAAFRAQRQVDALQPDRVLLNRWQWISNYVGLQPPDRGSPYITLVHRPDEMPMPVPGAVRLHVHYHRDAMLYAHDLERLWRDLGPIIGRGRTWTLREMQPVLPATSLLQQDLRHYMLSTIAEDQTRPQQVPIFFEVEWLQAETRHRGYTKPWVDKRMTVVQFLQQQGLLAQCTTTHRCDIQRNGRRQQFALMILDKADYIFLIGKPFLPHSDSEDDTHEPGACMLATREHTPSSFTASSNSLDDDEDQISASETDEEAISNIPTWVTAIFRANLGLGSPPFMHSTHGEGSRQWIQDVYQTWPRLRYARWSHHKVHHSFQRDYPQGDIIEHRVLVTLTDLPSTFHQVTLIAGNYGEASFFQAWPFPPYIDPPIVLDEIGIWDICQQEPGSCKVYLNGLAMDLHRRSAITHGDYILIRIRGGRDPAIRSRVARAFGIPDNQHGHEYATAMGTARIGGEGAAAVNTEIVPYHSLPHGRQAQLHEGYWFVMALFAWTAGFLLLRMQLACEKRRSTIGYKVGRTRTSRGRRCNCWRRPPWLLLWLVATQNLGQTTTGLQVHTAGSEQDTGPDNPLTAPRLLAPGYWRQTGHHVALSPPGNTPTRPLAECTKDDPLQIDNFLADNCTTVAVNMRQHIVMLIEAHQIRTKLASLCQRLGSKVPPSTEFTEGWLAPAVLSTPPGRDNTLKPEDLNPQVVEVAADFRLERCSAKEGQDKDLETQPSTQTVGQIAASLGVSNLGAPNNKNPQTFSFKVGPDLADDDDALHTAWNMEPPPLIDQLPGLHPTSLRSMQLLTPRSTRIQDKVTDHWHIYTDGSAGRNDETEGNLSSWACVIYTAKKPTVTVDDVNYVDWIGGITETDPLAADWTGATEHSSRHAEATALVWGMLYYLQLGTHAPLHLHCDPLVILKAVKGEWQFDLADTPILRARATFLLLWTFLKSDLTLEHVKGHAGHFGNELSDVIAGAIRTGILEPRVPKVNLARWYHGTNPAICWAWTQIDAEARQGQVMACQEGWLQWQQVDEPDIALGWTTWRQQTTDTLQTYELALSVTTYNVGTLKDNSRAAFLREQAEWMGLNVLGLQETRNAYDNPGDSNFIRIVAKAENGIGGCELWLSRTIPFARQQDQPLYFRRDNIHVVVAKSQILLVQYVIKGLAITFLVGHAPHSGHRDDDIQRWWKGVSKDITKYAKSSHLIVMIDANADLQEDPPYSGSILHGHREGDRAGDRELRDLLHRFTLWAPSTFPEVHHGHTTTWTANDTTKNARNDFVLLPCEWKDFQVKSLPIPDLDSGVGGMDHQATGVTIQGWFLSTPPQRARSFDRQQIGQATELTWKQFFEDWPEIPWHLDPTSHAAILERHLQTKLAETFPIIKKNKKRSQVFSETTWDLFTLRNRLKKVLNHNSRAWDSLQTFQAFISWRKDDKLHALTLRQICYCLKICDTVRRHKATSDLIKKQISKDRATYMHNRMADVGTKDPKQILQTLKPMRMGRRVQHLGRKPLPMIHLEDGTSAPSFHSAQDRWRRHFARMEGGHETSPQELLRQQARLPQGDRIDVAQFPTIFELERQCRMAKPYKAMGPDGIPSELIKCAASHISFHFWPLFAKTTLCRQEAIQYKGGNLVAAYKQRGPTTECGSYRALLVSSSLAKSFHSVYRRRAMEFVYRGAGQLQFTSHRSPSVGLAGHIVRLHQQAGRREGKSTAILFLDIKEAFYCVIRQHSLPASFADEDIFRFLQRMGITDLHIDQVAALLAEGPSLEALGCDEHLLAMVTEFHRATWFQLATDQQGPLIHTEKGTRPGDGFADVLWALTFSKWLQRLERHLEKEEVLTAIPWNGQCNLDTNVGHQRVTKGIVAWADDVAVMADSVDALRAVEKLIYLTEVLVRDLLEFGMTPNFGASKTEAVLDIRGRHSHVLRRSIFNDKKGLLQLDTQLEGRPALRIVAKYKHLGGYVAHGCRIRPELQHRLAQGRSTCSDYRSKLFTNKEIPLLHRLQVLRATALKATTYNSTCWPTLTPKDAKLWTHGVLALYRIAMQKTLNHQELRHLPDHAVLAKCQALHPMTELRVQRLRGYAQCLRRHYPVFWALLAVEQEWKEQVNADFQWLYDNIKGLTCHPSPRQDMGYWTDLIKNQYGRWQGLLKRVTNHAILQQRIRSDVKMLHRSVARMINEAGGSVVAHDQVTKDQEYLCFICNTTYHSYTAWAVHAFKRHGRVHAGRRLQAGTVCQACGKAFNTEARLTRHFRTVPRCASTMAAQNQTVQLQPGLGSTANEEQELQTVLQVWAQSDAQTLPPQQGWVATEQAKKLWTLLRDGQWSTEDEAREAIMTFLQQEPVSHLELKEIQEKTSQLSSEEETDIKKRILQECRDMAQRETKNDKVVEQEIDESFFLNKKFDLPPPIPRLPTVYRYVLHVFAGVRREGDLHSAIQAATPPDGTTLFPVSVDIVLSETHCDLLDVDQQKRWLTWSLQGAIFMAIGGPPCETWSISRLRWFDNHEGPRPLRDGRCLLHDIWGYQRLRLREARQIRVANALLQFCILLFLSQVISRGAAILEHPDQPGDRGLHRPASIWLLPVMRFIQSANSVFPLHIQQGYWNAYSPKPTLLLATMPSTNGTQLLKCLEGFRVRSDLPPPLSMGKCAPDAYATAKLKRYPSALCRGMAGIAATFADRVQFSQATSDPLEQVAKSLKVIYNNSCERTDDGNDFAGDRN